MSIQQLNNLNLKAGLEADGDVGSAGQVLSSTGPNGVEWINQSAITASSDFIYYEVKNDTGSTILKGKGVMAVGTDGNSGHILVDEMVADGTITPRYFLGVLETDIENGGFARVIAFGELDQFNTNGQNGETWSNGQVLWCDPDSPGDFTITEPDGPNVKIPAAFVLKASSQGKIQVRVQANEGVKDLYDTKIDSQVDGDVLVWDNTTGVWFNNDTLSVKYSERAVAIGDFTPPISGKLQISNEATDIWSTLIQLNSTGTQSRMSINNNGTGDSQINFQLLGSSKFTLGVDNSDSDKFKISGSSVLGSNDRLVIDSSGNVGIGTTSPSRALEINTTGSNNYQFRIGTNAYYYDIGRNTSNGFLNFYGNQSNASGFVFETVNGERMRIDHDGDVGIGTNAPTQKLHVDGNARVTGAYYDSNNAPGTSGQILSSTATGTNWISGSAIPGVPDGSGTTNYLARWTDADTLGIGTTYDNGTNVGIGTTSPETKLDVIGGSDYQTINIGESKTDNDVKRSGITFTHYDTDQPEVTLINSYIDSNISYVSIGGSSAAQVATENIRFFTAANTTTISGTERMRINSSGNVGIGTTSPSYKLDVSGNARVTGAYYDSNNSPGTSGQVLSSTASGTDWISIENLGTFLDIIDVSEPGNTTAEWSLIKTLPASDANQRDTLFIKIVGGGWNDNMRYEAEITLSNRDGFNYFWDVKGGSEYSTGGNGSNRLRVVAYSQTDGTVDVYLYKTSYMTGWIYATFQNTGAPEIIASLGSPTTTQPSGTEVFTTYGNTYPANIAAVNNRVGIGTTSPGEKLSVEPGADVSAEIGRAHIGNVGYAGYAGFSHVDRNSPGDYALLHEASGQTYLNARAAQNIRFRINNTDQMILTSGGKFGVGTTSPGEKLTVKGTDQYIAVEQTTYPWGGTNTLGLKMGTNGVSGLLDWRRWTGTGTDHGTAVIAQVNSDGGYGLDFRVDNQSTNTPATTSRMFLSSSGEVGIGTTSPSTKLHVFGTTSSIPALGAAPSAAHFGASAYGTLFSTLPTGRGVIQQGRVDGTATSYDLLLQPSGGNVAIGLTSATQKLHVGGSILATGAVYSGSTTHGFTSFYGSTDIQTSSGGSVLVRNGFTYRPIQASAFTVSSDYRLKSNITPLENAIDRLNQLNVHRFNWNDRLDEPKVDGFIAHEVSPIIPEAVLGEKDEVYEDGTPKHQGIDQAKIVPLLTAALQEAILKIEQLETRIQTLENN